MKKIRLKLDELKVQTFALGEVAGTAGTVRAFSGDEIMYPSDWNPLDCAPSGVDSGAMCGCGGQAGSGFANSCNDMTCQFYGC